MKNDVHGDRRAVEDEKDEELVKIYVKGAQVLVVIEHGAGERANREEYGIVWAQVE